MFSGFDLDDGHPSFVGSMTLVLIPNSTIQVKLEMNQVDELTNYIVTYYPNLMTFREKAANKAFLAEEKADNLEPGNMQRMLRRSWGSSDPEVLSLMANGREEFLRAVRDRIMNEHPDDIFLNYCPKCGALAKTPKAKQCPKCFFSWHGIA